MRLGYRMKIGSDEITSVWNDPWVRDLPNFRVQFMIMHGLEDLKVSDLLLEPGRWNEDFIHQILSPIEASIVCGQLLSRSQEHDFPIWHHSNSERYTIKSCCDMLLFLNGLTFAGFSEAWKRFWKLSLPPKVLAFAWRLCRNCLPLRVRLH